jgi:hypothetical protein
MVSHGAASTAKGSSFRERIVVSGKEAGVKAYLSTPNPDDAARRGEAP